MTNWKEHNEFQQALRIHLSNRGFTLNDDETYQSGIDCVGVFVENKLVLSVGLPPVSNYEIEETEHTSKYLRPHMAVAV